ncbi:MAG: 30S ribosomal protein S20, partial [Armatimonadetes bacterium]|nr:30S ribosomal protein S20 [Armatimonadota bacterium]
MPNIKSMIKDVKKSRERRLRAMSARSRIKTMVKKTKAALEAKAENAADVLRETVSIIDKAAKRGIIHPNAAARRKSRLMK